MSPVIAAPVTSTRSMPIRAIERGRTVIRALKRGRIAVAIMTVNSILFAGLFWLFEETDMLSAMYFSIVSGSTTGFGDMFPKTAGGKILVIYYLITMKVFNDIIAGHINAIIWEARNVFSHHEQESIKAALLEICQAMNVLPSDMRQLPGPDFWALKHGYVEEEDGITEEEDRS